MFYIPLVYFCVAVGSVRQRCHTLVVNFRCTSGTLPVWVLTSLEGLHLGHHGFDSFEVPSSAEEGPLPDRLVGSELSPRHVFVVNASMYREAGARLQVY